MKPFTHSPYYPLILGLILLCISLPSAIQQISTFSFFHEVTAKPIEPGNQKKNSAKNRKRKNKSASKKYLDKTFKSSDSSPFLGLLIERYPALGIVLGIIMILLAIRLSVVVFGQSSNPNISNNPPSPAAGGCSAIAFWFWAGMIGGLVIIGLVLFIKGLMNMPSISSPSSETTSDEKTSSKAEKEAPKTKEKPEKPEKVEKLKGLAADLEEIQSTTTYLIRIEEHLAKDKNNQQLILERKKKRKKLTKQIQKIEKEIPLLEDEIAILTQEKESKDIASLLFTVEKTLQKEIGAVDRQSTIIQNEIQQLNQEKKEATAGSTNLKSINDQMKQQLSALEKLQEQKANLQKELKELKEPEKQQAILEKKQRGIEGEIKEKTVVLEKLRAIQNAQEDPIALRKLLTEE